MAASPPKDLVKEQQTVIVSKRLELVFDHISATVPKNAIAAKQGLLDKLMASTKSVGEGSQKGPETKQILYDITGDCKPGELLAMMGPSGSGKTSLLSIIGGRTPPMVTTTGAVLINGEKLTKAIKRQTGFVTQDDLLYESLTVFETMYYAALLRLPKEMTQEQKVERVEQVVAALGLNKCRDTIIGGFFRRGISGGERKRVSVGHEMLINPSILMLDEPTSGLDSTTAMNLLQTLRELASGGRAVITTIHQPSSRLYQLLDKLLLLSDGHAMYYGSANLVVEWFGELGYKMPFGVNTADFILDCASGIVGRDDGRNDGKEGQEHMIYAAESYLAKNQNGYTEASGDSVKKLNVGLISAPGFSKDDPELGRTVSTAARKDLQKLISSPAKKNIYGASYWQQNVILFRRDIQVRRFENMNSQDITQMLVISILAGCFWWQKGRKNTIDAANDTMGLLTFVLLFSGLRAMLHSMFTFANDLKMLLKERASGMYRLSAYYFARMASDLPMDCLIPTLFVIIIYWMGGLRPTAGAFFATWATCMLNLLVSQGPGLIIGAIFTNMKTAQTVATVILISMLLMGGFFVRTLPHWISWMKYLSFVYYGFNIILHVEYGHRPLSDADGNFFSGKALQEKLKLQRNPDEFPWDVFVLLGFGIICRFLVYYALRSKTSSVAGRAAFS